MYYYFQDKQICFMQTVSARAWAHASTHESTLAGATILVQLGAEGSWKMCVKVCVCIKYIFGAVGCPQ